MPEFLREGYNAESINAAIAEELEISINFLDSTKDQIQISTATGNFLNDIASLFNLTRNMGESDDAFRARILSFISQSASSGSNFDIRNVISNFTGLPIDEIEVSDAGAGKILVETSVGNNFELANSIYDIVAKAKAAGIYAFLDIAATTNDDLTLVDSITISVLLEGRIYGLFVYGETTSKY